MSIVFMLMGLHVKHLTIVIAAVDYYELGHFEEEEEGENDKERDEDKRKIQEDPSAKLSGPKLSLIPLSHYISFPILVP